VGMENDWMYGGGTPPMSDPASLSRRDVFGALAGGAALLAGSAAVADAQHANSTAGQKGMTAGRKYRAYVRTADSASVQELTLRGGPLPPGRVLVRTEAAQCCYTISIQALGNAEQNAYLRLGERFTVPTILGHGGVGIVEAVGPLVTRVRVGERVIVSASGACGRCYNCLHGQPDRCLGGGASAAPAAGAAPAGGTGVGGGGIPHDVPIADTADGTPVIQFGLKGGLAELIISPEDNCVPVYTDVSSVELAMLHCVGICGLGTTTNLAPVEMGSDVVVFGLGPVGLSAIQGARIKGASQIIGVDPVRTRRELAMKLGATITLDPNAEGADLVHKINSLCADPRRDKVAGGGKTGPDFVIEAVGGDTFRPKVEVGPDPTGVLPLQQAWDLCSPAGHVVTTSVGHPSDAFVKFQAANWANGRKKHHSGNMAGSNAWRDLPRYVRLIERGQFDAKSMANAVYPIERVGEAFQAVADRTVVAAVIKFT
jgi:S-(hydroxymethyl)glutathione dehydrogenase / alcohol dehydrogenase